MYIHTCQKPHHCHRMVHHGLMGQHCFIYLSMHSLKKMTLTNQQIDYTVCQTITSYAIMWCQYEEHPLASSSWKYHNNKFTGTH